ncbi:hypothetical protein B0H10DRAFT_1969662 [Mycena sp. CBHHK59/15]|nr:hypothetical protein B0H10DRAFT_1969662 [Mycena sp. CBHHK59/15]
MLSDHLKRMPGTRGAWRRKDRSSPACGYQESNPGLHTFSLGLAYAMRTSMKRVNVKHPFFNSPDRNQTYHWKAQKTNATEVPGVKPSYATYSSVKFDNDIHKGEGGLLLIVLVWDASVTCMQFDRVLNSERSAGRLFSELYSYFYSFYPLLRTLTFSPVFVVHTQSMLLQNYRRTVSAKGYRLCARTMATRECRRLSASHPQRVAAVVSRATRELAPSRERRRVSLSVMRAHMGPHRPQETSERTRALELPRKRHAPALERYASADSARLMRADGGTYRGSDVSREGPISAHLARSGLSRVGGAHERGRARAPDSRTLPPPTGRGPVASSTRQSRQLGRVSRAAALPRVLLVRPDLRLQLVSPASGVVSHSEGLQSMSDAARAGKTDGTYLPAARPPLPASPLLPARRRPTRSLHVKSMRSRVLAPRLARTLRPVSRAYVIPAQLGRDASGVPHARAADWRAHAAPDDSGAGVGHWTRTRRHPSAASRPQHSPRTAQTSTPRTSAADSVPQAPPASATLLTPSWWHPTPCALSRWVKKDVPPSSVFGVRPIFVRAANSIRERPRRAPRACRSPSERRLHPRRPQRRPRRGLRPDAARARTASCAEASGVVSRIRGFPRTLRALSDAAWAKRNGELTLELSGVVCCQASPGGSLVPLHRVGARAGNEGRAWFWEGSEPEGGRALASFLYQQRWTSLRSREAGDRGRYLSFMRIKGMGKGRGEELMLDGFVPHIRRSGPHTCLTTLHAAHVEGHAVFLASDFDSSFGFGGRAIDETRTAEGGTGGQTKNGRRLTRITSKTQNSTESRCPSRASAVQCVMILDLSNSRLATSRFPRTDHKGKKNQCWITTGTSRRHSGSILMAVG